MLMPDVNTIACVPCLPAALLGKGCCNAAAPNTHTINKTLVPLLQDSPGALGNSNWQDNLLMHTSQPSEHKISLDAKGLKTKI